MPDISNQMVSVPLPVTSRKRKLNLVDHLKPVANGMIAYTTDVHQSVAAGISALYAVANTASRNVRRKTEDAASYLRPKYARDLLWGSHQDRISGAAQYSLFADTLP